MIQLKLPPSTQDSGEIIFQKLVPVNKNGILYGAVPYIIHKHFVRGQLKFNRGLVIVNLKKHINK